MEINRKMARTILENEIRSPFYLLANIGKISHADGETHTRTHADKQTYTHLHTNVGQFLLNPPTRIKLRHLQSQTCVQGPNLS